MGHRSGERAVHHRLRGGRLRGGAAGGPRSPARVGSRGRRDRAAAARRRRSVPAGRGRPAATHGGAVAPGARRLPGARTHAPGGAQARQRHGRPRVRLSATGPAPGAPVSPGWPLAGADRNGARQPPLAPRARAQVRARGRAGNWCNRHHQLHGMAPGRLPVVVAPRDRVDRIDRARRRLDRDRRRALGPPGQQLRRGPGEIAALQHLDTADADHRGAHLLSRALRGEPGLGVVRPRPRRDERIPPHEGRLRRPVRADLVRRVGRDRRRRPRHRPGVRRSDPRGRVLEARGGPPRPARAREHRQPRSKFRSGRAAERGKARLRWPRLWRCRPACRSRPPDPPHLPRQGRDR